MRLTHISAALLLAFPGVALAQQNYSNEGTAGFAIEAIRPAMEGVGHSFASVALFSTGHVELRPGLRLLLELPVAFSSEFEDVDMDGPVLGDPYLGVQARTGATTLDFGFRAPIASDAKYASVIGTVADLDRVEAFAPDILTVRAGAATDYRLGRGITLGAQLSPAVWIPTDDAADEGDTEFVLGYGASVGYAASGGRLTARFSGRALLSEEGLDFDERTLHQIAMTGSIGDRVRPGFQVSMPLDGDALSKVAFGLTLQAAVGERPNAVARR